MISASRFGLYNQERPKSYDYRKFSPDPDDHMNLVNVEDDDLIENVEMNPDVVARNDPSPVIMDKIEDCFDTYNSPRDRCPSFTCQLNERLSGNVIQHYFITDEMISNAAKYAAQIACVNLSYSTYIPSSSTDPSAHHCCPICQRSLLLAVSQFFYNNNMDDIHDLSPGMPINPSTPKFAATLQVQQGMEHSLTKILQSLRAVLHIRPTELIHALHYFDVLLKRHWMCSTFILFRQSLKTIFAVCCLIAHKMNSDNPFRNTAWSELFGMPIQTINEFERSILTLLEYETRLDEDGYHQLEAIVGVGEDYYISLGSQYADMETETETEVKAETVTVTEPKVEIETETETESEAGVYADVGARCASASEKARTRACESVRADSYGGGGRMDARAEMSL